MLLAMTLIGAALWSTRRFAPEAAGSGIPHLHAVLHRLHGMRWGRLLPVKFFGGVLGISGGLALGREGPTVQMGGALGEMVGRISGCTARERQALLCAGAGAGLSAAFNAPLAGLVFVLEELRRDFAPGVFSTTFAASVVAGTLTRLALGQHPVFRIAEIPTPPISMLPAFLILGMVAGLVGLLFQRTLFVALDVVGSARWKSPWLPAGLIAAIVGAAGFLAPGTVGGGGQMVEATLLGGLTLPTLAGLFLLRLFLTTTSYATGAPGGIFAPLLVLGAQTGLAVATLGTQWLPGSPELPVSAFTVVGMAALFAAVVRAPLTGVVLILEMTESYPLMLALLTASLAAWGVAELAGSKPIYQALLGRQLQGSAGGATLDEALLVDLVIAPGAPFDGRLVEQLGLPGGVLLVELRRGLESRVPRRDTLLEAGDRLVVMVSPDAADAITALEQGAEAPS
jgi:CIC family chloride channel protein